MELMTRVETPRCEEGLRHSDGTLVLGSCFADNIGGRLKDDKFDVVVNPFGTLYNPASICAHLLRCLSEREYQAGDGELLYSDGLWHSWMHHSTFSDPDRDALLARMNEALHTTAQQLRSARWLIVTFGTAYTYRLKDSGLLVANCHKQPDALFVRQRLAAVDIVDMWTTALQLLHSVNSGLQVIMTVSPIRHRRDGLHQNQLSKAELLIATDQLAGGFNLYFPSYEIMMDELRDYRYYADDLVHPSALAVELLYERFTHSFVPEQEQRLTEQCRAIRQVLNHRPQNPESPQYRQLIEKQLQLIQDLQAAHPQLDWQAEIELCHTRLNR